MIFSIISSHVPIGSAQADINWYSCVELSVHWSIGQANAPLNCIVSAATSREKMAIFLKTGRVNELSLGLFPKFNARKRAGPKPTQFVRTIACAFKIISKRCVGQWIAYCKPIYNLISLKLIKCDFSYGVHLGQGNEG